MKTAWTLVLAVAAACGGASKPESTEPAAGPGAQGDRKASIDKFHDTLAPRWHAQQGPQRMADTCATMPQFQAEAGAIVSAQPPAENAAMWSEKTKQLSDAIAQLEVTCKASDAAGFEPAFARMHETFHGVMEAAGGHQGEHGKGEHGEHSKGEHGKGEHGEHGKGEHSKGEQKQGGW
jgi:hypothetical protein